MSVLACIHSFLLTPWTVCLTEPLYRVLKKGQRDGPRCENSSTTVYQDGHHKDKHASTEIISTLQQIKLISCPE